MTSRGISIDNLCIHANMETSEERGIQVRGISERGEDVEMYIMEDDHGDLLDGRTDLPIQKNTTQIEVAEEENNRTDLVNSPGRNKRTNRNKWLTLKEKEEIIIKIKSGVKQKDLVDQYKTSKSVVSRLSIPYTQEKLLKQSKNTTKKCKKVVENCQFKKINDFMEEWVANCNSANVPVTYQSLKDIGYAFAKKGQNRKFLRFKWLG